MTHVLADPMARLRARLAERAAGGLLRRLQPRAAHDRVIDLASNDYLGLARDPRIAAAAADALRVWGVGATGSRLVTGSTELHEELEVDLASHCGAEAALVFSSGYLANIGTIAALAGPDVLVVSDAHNHASVIDGCRLARARVQVVPHNDVHAVDAALGARAEPFAVVVTDAIFSVDGDAARIADLHDVVRRHSGLLVVDEAHSLGVVGSHGEGMVAAAGLGHEPDVVRTVTLSKSLGSQGGAVLGARDVIDYLVNTARTFVFDTALSPACVGAALASLRILHADPELATAARRNAGRLAALVGRPQPPAAVVSVVVGEPAVAADVAAHCAARGLRVGCFRPPSVPDGLSRIRLTARANLSDAEFERAAEVLRVVGYDAA
ncbi:MAG: 8-amino-7-oxononanoate synthase [Actinomycetes bacterium]